MKKMKVNQFLPNLDRGDAISNYAIEVKNLLANAGYDSQIYVNSCSEKMKNSCKHYSEYVGGAQNVAIFHFSIGSMLDDFIFDLKEKLIIVYHNTTPSKYFHGVNEKLVRLLENADGTLLKLKKRTSLAIGVSEFNSEHLKKLGFKNVATIPLIIDLESLKQEIDKNLYEKYRDKCVNILFVGRLAPNKKQEDLIKSFYIYNKHINPRSRLFIVGNYLDTEKYFRELLKITKSLDLNNNVFFTGFVPLKELATYYRLSDVFLSMSEHEGFMVPLLECMKLRVPILAFNSSAIPYTMGDTGIIFNKKNYGAVAELIDYAVRNKNEIVEKQNERLKFFDAEKIKKDFLSQIEKLK